MVYKEQSSTIIRPEFKKFIIVNTYEKPKMRQEPTDTYSSSTLY
jgi:hypothetical protein